MIRVRNLRYLTVDGAGYSTRCDCLAQDFDPPRRCVDCGATIAPPHYDYIDDRGQMQALCQACGEAYGTMEALA